MRFHIERGAFADAVAWAARSLPARPAVPVLAGVLLDVGSDGPAEMLSLSSFDYEVSAHAEVSVVASQPGRVLVSGRLLAEISRALPSAPVDVTVENSRVVLTCGSARFTLPTLPIDDYPTLPDLPAAAGTVGADVFADAVAQVAVAAGRDDTLPVLTAVRLEIDGDKLTLAATDRYRLAVRELSWSPERTGLSAVALVPARTLADTAKALTGGAQVTVALATSETGQGLIGFVGHAADGGGERRTTTRLLDGEYVKYRSLLPDSSAASAVVETAEFVDAVKRVALVAPRNTPVRLTFTSEQVLLEAGTGEDAQASEFVPAHFETSIEPDSAGGGSEGFAIAFNPGYLLDGLSAVQADQTRLDFTAPTKPAVLRSAKDDGSADAAERAQTVRVDDYRYLLMPVRLSG